MAATTSMSIASIQPVLTAKQAVNARSSFTVSAAPLRHSAVSKNSGRSFVVRASAEEVETAPKKTAVVLSTLLGATAAALVGLSGNAIAASGPGIPGAQRTAEKADELLKSADSLTTNESPPRFGPGRAGPDQTSQLAQKAGSGASEAIQGTQKTLEQGADKAKDAVASVPDLKAGASDVASKAGEVTDNAPNLFSSIQGTFQSLTGSAPSVDDVKAKADSAVGEAKSQLPGQ